MIEDPPPHDRATVTNNSSESTDRSERVPAVILSLLPLFLFHSVRPFLASSRHDHLSLSLSSPTLCPTLFSNKEEGRNPLPRVKRSQSFGLRGGFDRDARACVSNPLHRPSPPPLHSSLFFFRFVAEHASTRGRRHAKIVVTGADRTRGRCQRLSSVPLQLKSPFILCTVSDCVCCAYKVWTMRILKYRRF